MGEGDAVKKGGELAQLDVPDKSAEIAETEAALLCAGGTGPGATSIQAAEADVKTKVADITAAEVELRPPPVPSSFAKRRR